MPTDASPADRDPYQYFDRLWHPLFKRSGLGYYSDLCFVFAQILGPRTEMKFRFGLASWLLWFFGIHFWQKPSVRPLPVSYSLAISGISTPAHEETVCAFAESYGMGRESIRVFGPSECPESINLVAALPPLNLTSIQQSLTKPERLRALLRATSLALKIRKAARPDKAIKSSIRASFPSIMDALTKLEGTRIALKGQINSGALHALTYELQPEMKALVLACREEGARVLHLMHGQWLTTYQVTMATDILLFSQVDLPWFRKRVEPVVTLWAGGHPRVERLRRTVYSKPKTDHHQKPRIAFFSQPVEGGYSRETRLRDWAILLPLKGVTEVRIRLHPRESLEQARADLETAGLDFMKLSEAGLTEDLAWCDAIASSWSTVAMEAAACGRGVFWTCSTPERYEASRELRSHGIGVLISNASEWFPHLDDWITTGWNPPVRVPEGRLRELGMIGDMEKSWLERLHIQD
jgi:hypothetical protein